ncbi:MAG: site-specific recombinase [Alphaproteobacteria bacterium]|nr:site-specific recombinase [Alphaproteobacteria bacterium]
MKAHLPSSASNRFICRRASGSGLSAQGLTASIGCHFSSRSFLSGGNIERPALQRLLDDLRAGKVDIIVVYKVDRLTRSLADFAKLVELFDQHGVSFVSVTQQFNTTTSKGRLTLIRPMSLIGTKRRN